MYGRPHWSFRKIGAMETLTLERTGEAFGECRCGCTLYGQKATGEKASSKQIIVKFEEDVLSRN